MSAAELKLPLDYDRLPEYRLFVDAIGKSPSSSPGCIAGFIAQDPTILPALAAFAFLRLFANLGYEASVLNEPGALSPAGYRLLKMEVDGYLLEAMEVGGLLKKRDDGTWFCARFEKGNAHLSGSYEKNQNVGNRHSALKRGSKDIPDQAAKQAELIPKDKLRTRAGVEFTADEVQAALVHIRMIDRSMGLRDRHTQTYSEGLMADAHASLPDVPTDEKARMQLYYWIQDKFTQGHPSFPKTTAQVLSMWPTLMKMREEN